MIQDFVWELVDKITAGESELPTDEFGYMQQFSDADFQSNGRRLW